MTLRVTALARYPLKSGRGEALESAVVERLGLAGDRRWMLAGADGETLTAREEPRLLLIRAALVGAGIRITLPDGTSKVVEPVETARRPEPTPPGSAGPRIAVTVHRNPVRDVVTVSPEVDAWLSDYAGRQVRLVHADRATSRTLNPTFTLPTDSTAFADGYPVLLTTEASLAQLNAWIADGPLASEGPLDMRRFRPNLVVDGEEPFAEDSWRLVRIGGAVFRAPKGCDRCVMTTTDPDTAARGKEPVATLARRRRWDGKTWFGMNLVPDAPGATIRVGDEVEVLEAVESDGPPR